MSNEDEQTIAILRQYIKENGVGSKTIQDITVKDPREEQLKQLEIVTYTKKEEAK